MKRLALELRRRGEVDTFPRLVVPGLIAVLGSVALTRFDVVPAVLVVIGLLMIINDRHRLGGLALGPATSRTP